MHRRPQRDHVGPGNGAERAVFQSGYPWDHGAVAEPQNKLGVHRQLAARSDDELHDLRAVAAERHEIDKRRRPGGGLELDFEHQRVRTIAARDARFLTRRYEPVAVFSGAEQRSEAHFRIETRPARPIDRSVTRDKRSASAIADQRIVFDGCGHDGYEVGSGEINDDFDVAGLPIECLRPLLDGHAPRDQPTEPGPVGTL